MPIFHVSCFIKVDDNKTRMILVSDIITLGNLTKYD